jgi:hypothetical protein
LGSATAPLLSDQAPAVDPEWAAREVKALAGQTVLADESLHLTRSPQCVDFNASVTELPGESPMMVLTDPALLDRFYPVGK